MRYIKKAAMFGLDARIALAIFGALSIITSAALYKTITNARLTTIHQNLVNIEKAIEAIYTDLGYLPKSDNGRDFDARYLSSNPDNLSGWKGPYYPTGTNPKSNNNFFVADNMLLSTHLGYRNSCNGTYLPLLPHKPITMTVNDYDKESYSSGCQFDWNLAKQIHDNFDSDKDYSKGKIQIFQNPTDPSLCTLNILLDIPMY